MEQIVSENTFVNPAPYPPSVKGFPIIGAIPQLLREQVDFLENARAQYSDIYTLNLGATSMVMLNHPEHAQHVMVDHARNYSKGGPIWDAARAVIGNGLVTSEGDFWLRQRRMMQPHFHRQRLGALTEVMVTAIEEALSNWQRFADQPDPLDVAPEFAHITMTIIMRTMFGADMSDEEFGDIGTTIGFIIDNMLPQALTKGIPSWIPVPKRAQYQKALNSVNDFIYRVIEKRRNNRSNDLISMLLDATDDESGEQMTDQQLRDEVITIFTAGYETTALTLSWVAHYLTQQPEIAETLQQEIDTVLGKRTPTFEDLMRLPFTRQVLQESMRLCPPGFFVTRTALEDDVIDGFRIRAGQTVAITIYTIQRHPEFWPSPEVFDPNRFSPEQVKGRHNLAWMPFGAGQRMCLGRDFAYMEGTLILAMLTQRFNMRAPVGFFAKPRFSATLRPAKGVLVHLTRR
jgi:cytochrome P450